MTICMLRWNVVLLLSVVISVVVVGVDGLALHPETNNPTLQTRRGWLHSAVRRCVGVSATLATTTTTTTPILRTNQAYASEDLPAKQFNPDDSENQEFYNNPAIPPAPEERSGLVVLRVAEVAQFQEKILRAVESGTLQGVSVAPMQFAFGTQILLRNSGIDSNMKLMINDEIPKSKRPLAAKSAAAAMNTLQDIYKFSASIQRDFEKDELLQLADMYLTVRVNLNQLYEYLPQKEKDKYYGYFMAVTEYEKKIAEGVYNPDIDGVLTLEY